MLDDKNTETIINIVNDNRNYYRIGEYIISNFNINLDMNIAKKIGKRLIIQEGYTQEEILNGYADKLIKNILNYYKLKKSSVVQKNEKTQDIPLKTKKTKVSKKFIVTVAGSILTMSMIYGIGIKPLYNEIKDNQEIRQSINMATSDGITDYSIDTESIVSKNTYVAGKDANGYPVIAYYNDGIAEDIIKACTEDSNLFDLCMYNVYFDMNYNRLGNMDDVVRYLKSYTENDESLSFIQDKLHNCDVFLEYLISRGFANPNDKDYNQLLEDIKTYKLSNNQAAFNALNNDAQRRIEELVKEFKNNRSNLIDEYKDNLEEKGVSYGTRS